MPQSGAGPSVPDAAAAEASAQKVKTQQNTKAQQQDKTAENRSKAKQNKEKAAQNRARKAQNVSFAEDNADSSAGPTGASSSATPSESSAKQPKKQPKKDFAKAQAPRPGNVGPTHFKSKVVVRRLPPNLPEEVFWKAVAPWIRDAADCKAPAATAPQTSAETPQDALQAPSTTSTTSSPASLTPTVDFKKFVAGKLKNDANKSNKYARAYVRFLDPQSLVQFHKAFDGHIFRDSKGKESVAIVEFAPYQKVVLPPSTGQRGRRARPDPKQGTIEKDADYLSFVERLNKAGEDVKRSEGDLLASLHDPKGKEKEKEAKDKAGKATPLLQHLRAVKMAKLESAAAIKKAKKQEKAAAKAALTRGAGVDGAVAGTATPVDGKKKNKKKKDKGKDKVKSVSAVGIGAEADAKNTSADKEKSKNKEGKGKAPVNGNVDTTGGAEKGAQGQSAKQPPKGPANTKPEAKVNNTDTATKSANTQGDAAGKAKSKPPRRKGGAKDKDKPAPSASAQPSKVQILKRDP